MNASNKSDYLRLHAAVWLFSLCALFAYWVNTGPVFIVFGRTFFAALGIGLYLWFRQTSVLSVATIPRYRLLLSSILLVVHWLTFFYAAQQASVSIALITFASYPLWVLLIDWFRGNALTPVTMLGQAVLIMAGIALVSGVFDDMSLWSDIQGLTAGLLSAMTFAWLTDINQALVKTNNTLNLTFWQNLLASMLLIPMVLILPFNGDITDIGKLFLLGIIFTAFAHNLLLSSMRSIPAFLVSVSVCLEPAYGIVAAAILFSEPLTTTVICGIVLVLMSNVWALSEQRKASAARR
ncbi:DMT family transporter [Thalassotalea litorea]|uniref:DMT family transporter n=1 Tax=Thalassotalea litorea TaxID=2020715 RepID=UPI003736BFAE